MGTATVDQNRKGSKGKPQEPLGPKGKKKGKGRGMLMFLVLYGVGCGVGGAYADRHLVPQARVWLGNQAQTLADMGMEQKIQGCIDQADLTPSEKQGAERDIRVVYEARAAGRLSGGDLEKLSRAEIPFHVAATRGQQVPESDLQDALDTFSELAKGH
jgi:hypothetical protein